MPIEKDITEVRINASEYELIFYEESRGFLSVVISRENVLNEGFIKDAVNKKIRLEVNEQDSIISVKVGHYSVFDPHRGGEAPYLAPVEVSTLRREVNLIKFLR